MKRAFAVVWLFWLCLSVGAWVRIAFAQSVPQEVNSVKIDSIERRVGRIEDLKLDARLSTLETMVNDLRAMLKQSQLLLGLNTILVGATGGSVIFRRRKEQAGSEEAE